MSWTALISLVLVTGLLLVTALLRRQSHRRMRTSVRARQQAEEVGATAQLQHPVIDLSRCLGCGTCVSACPEEGVLDLVHGQAMVVRGARCVGHAACETACPVDAITVTLGDTSEREDIPALVTHFLEQFSRKMSVEVPKLKQRHMIELQAYQWPEHRHRQNSFLRLQNDLWPVAPLLRKSSIDSILLSISNTVSER